jgi:hypothetical protein
MPTQFTGEIEIFGNSMLASINLPYLERIDDVSVHDNADLVSINIPRLTDVDQLSIRTTGGARSATRTTTVRPILTTSAATRTGASRPRTSRLSLTPRAHPFSSSSSPPSSSPPHIW